MKNLVLKLLYANQFLKEFYRMQTQFYFDSNGMIGTNLTKSNNGNFEMLIIDKNNKEYPFDFSELEKKTDFVPAPTLQEFVRQLVVSDLIQEENIDILGLSKSNLVNYLFELLAKKNKLKLW